MKNQSKMNWSEFVFLIIGALLAVYRIIADIVTFAGMQVMLLDYDPGTPAYTEKAAGLAFPIIDSIVCAVVLAAMLIVLLIRLFYKGGIEKKGGSTWIRISNADAPMGGEKIPFTNEGVSAPPIETCPECGARIYNIDLDSDRKEKEEKIKQYLEGKKNE